MNDSSFIANGGNFTFPDKANVRPERLFFRLPLDRINWLTSSFLVGTVALTLTAVPLYLWFFGLDWFQVGLFFAMLVACGFSVTLGYHRQLLMCGHSLIARLTIAVFLFPILGVTSVGQAEMAGTSSAGTRKLFINPSSTSVALGKASLIVSPLTHREGNYVGDYQLKVRPYFFKSEKGSLLLAASDDAVRKLQAGTAINFTGQAVTHKDGRTHIVLGRATPSSSDRGSVTFSIVTDDARIVFNTSYHFPAPPL